MTQKLASLETRLALHRKTKMEFLTRKLPLNLAIALIASGFMVSGMNLLMYDITGKYVFEGFWRFLWMMLIPAVCLQVPLMMATLQRKPTQMDVEMDQAFRRSKGMDDSLDS